MNVVDELTEKWKRINTAIVELVEEKRIVRMQISEAGGSLSRAGRPLSLESANAERDERIVALFKKGKTLQEIGDTFEITRERTRQILKRYGYAGKDGGSHGRTINTRCNIEDCSAAGHSQGMCEMHYLRFVSSGDPQKDRRKNDRVCSVDGCDLKHKSNDYCNTHLSRWRKTGDAGSAEIVHVGKHKNRGVQGKLSVEQISEIRSLYRREKAVAGKPNEFSCTSLAKMYGVTPSHISNIVKHKNGRGERK